MLIILMHKQQGGLQTLEVGSPQKEEWAIINRYKAIEFERMKAREREIDRQKKETFRRELDNQLNTRSNAEQLEKQQDKNYYEQLSMKAEMTRQKEEHERQMKWMKRKQMQEENLHKVEHSKSSRVKDYDTGYHLDIGQQSEHEHKVKSEQFKKQMMDTLDMQLREKSEEQRRNKMQTMQLEEMHKQIQDGYFRPQGKKQYSQNQRIYDYYQQLEHQRAYKEKELDQRFVEEARERSLRAADQRARMEEEKKYMDKNKVKQILDEQVKQLNRKRHEDSKINPEDISYDFISNMFRPKEQTFDREKYKKELQQQAEEQRQRKAKQNHMSEEEYRLNLNQLSKAVVGSYAQQNYLDRSLGAIGDHKKYELADMQHDLKDKDADIIKKRLETLRTKGNLSYVE